MLRLTYLLMAVLQAAAAAQGTALASGDTSRIALDAPERRAVRPIALEDIVAVREVAEPVVSPNGQWTAFLVRQGFLDCNCYRTALFVVSNAGIGQPRKLVEERLLSDVRWAPDGRSLSYLSTRSGSRQLWWVALEGGSPGILINHVPGQSQTYYELTLTPSEPAPIGVDRYEWSPDGSLVAFVTRPASDTALVRHLTENGVAYDDDRMRSRDIQLKQWTREPAELWIYDVGRKVERRLWRAPRKGVRFSYALGIADIAWSPDAKRIALTYSANISRATAVPNYDLGVVTVANGRFLPLIQTDSMLESAPAWSPDGRSIAFGSVFLTAQDLTGRLASLGVIVPATRRVRYFSKGNAGRVIDRLWWDEGGTSLIFETSSPAGVVRKTGGLYSVDLTLAGVRQRSAADEHISRCSSQAGGQVACVRQSPRLPADPALVDLRTGASRNVAVTNPQLSAFALASVTEIQWRDRLGVPTNGYLIKPPSVAGGKRYPLVVVLYGFEGRFTTAAEWITSYPSQVLAHDGFVVLLANYPRYDAWRGDDYTKGTIATGDGALASLQAIVHCLGQQGLIDTARVGIAGWSYGGFLAEFAITHSHLFRVASVGNNGDYNPGAYWLVGWRGYRRFMENTLGGPPYGQTLAGWVAFAPAFNAHRVSIPVLMESSAEEALAGLEMYSALRHYAVPVEFVIYPDDGHVLLQPVHRLASMQRNLEWFSFWLRAVESTDPAKAEQYRRWRLFRQQLKRPQD